MFINPFFIYIFSFMGAFILYQFGWSMLYPKMNIVTIIFFIFTFYISFFLGFSIKEKIRFIKIDETFSVNKSIFVIVVLSLLDIVADRYLPIIQVIQTHQVNRYYGLPLIHPFLLTFSSFIGVYIFHLLICTKQKKYLLFFIVSCLPSVIFYSRGTLMITFITCMFVTLIFNKNKWNIKKIILLILALIFVMYLFGYLGNARSYGSSEVIYSVGGVSDEFLKSKIPSEFFWSYIYYTSPLANFVNNVNFNNVAKNITLSNINYFCITHFVPDVISNRLVAIFNYPKAYEFTANNIRLINGSLTVSTIYINSFYILGWLGPILIFACLCIYIKIIISLLKSTNPFFITGVSFLNTTIGLCFFANMLSQSSALAPIVYSIILGYFVNKRKARLNY